MKAEDPDDPDDLDLVVGEKIKIIDIFGDRDENAYWEGENQDGRPCYFPRSILDPDDDDKEVSDLIQEMKRSGHRSLTSCYFVSHNIMNTDRENFKIDFVTKLAKLDFSNNIEFETILFNCCKDAPFTTLIEQLFESNLSNSNQIKRQIQTDEMVFFNCVETVTTEETEFTALPIYKIKEIMADNAKFKE